MLQRDDLPFPRSLPEFQRLFPDEAACAAYLERARWRDGFVCAHCGASGEPRYISTRPVVLRFRKYRCDTSLTAGTVLVAGAVEVRQCKQQGSRNKRRTGRYAGRVRLAVAPDRSAKSLVGFIGRAVTPGATIITDDWSGYAKLGERGYCHTAVAERGDMQVAETFLPIIHLVFSNLKIWLRGIHYGVSPQHLQAYLDEFTFRFNRRFYPFNAFRSMLGIAGGATAPTYSELYAAKSRTTTDSVWV